MEPGARSNLDHVALASRTFATGRPSVCISPYVDFMTRAHRSTSHCVAARAISRRVRAHHACVWTGDVITPFGSSGFLCKPLNDKAKVAARHTNRSTRFALRFGSSAAARSLIHLFFLGNRLDARENSVLASLATTALGPRIVTGRSNAETCLLSSRPVRTPIGDQHTVWQLPSQSSDRARFGRSRGAGTVAL
jgi:hypothetical protein